MIRILPFIILLVLGSCYHENKPEPTPPDQLMPESQVIDVLTNLQLAEGIISYKRLGKTNVSREFKDSVYQIIFDRYGISSE